MQKGINIEFKEAECYKIDRDNNKVYCRSGQDTNLGGEEEFSVDYDYLVIAMGARSNTFNTPGVVENCHFLKVKKRNYSHSDPISILKKIFSAQNNKTMIQEVEDAQRIRRTVIDCFERASLPNLSEEERKRILHFVVVGGGPTGVEFAAELHDFVLEDLAKLYPSVKNLAKITLLEAGDHILNM